MVIRFRSNSFRTLIFAGLFLVPVMLIWISTVLVHAAEDDDDGVPPQPVGPERVAEEADIFRERARETTRRERQEAKKKKKTPKAPTASQMFLFSSTAPSDVTDGFGLISRGGHLGGKTFGRNDSITPLEVLPYVLQDEHFFFADVRGFVSNRSLGGGNLGVGYRNLREDYNAWYGGSFWYDADDTSSKLFHQVGLSFEGLIQNFEMRSNVYLPITTSQTISNSISSASIVGNQLLFGRSVNDATALRGVDGEIGYSLPIQDRHTLRGFVGFYHFDGGPSGGVNGFRARAEAVVHNGATAQVMFTNDKLYGSNVMVGLQLQFPFGNNHPTSGWKRNTPSPFRFVERNYNVILDHQVSNLGNQVAIDPKTGLPYNIQQVYVPANGGAPQSNASPTRDGTTTNPWTSIADAQAAGGNVIIVQSGSILSESVTLTSGQHLFGQGNYIQNLAVAGGGYVQVPLQGDSTQTGSVQSPMFSNVNGNAITLAHDTEVAGFTFSGTSGHGIYGNNVGNVSMHDLKFISTGGDSIHMQNSSGTVSMYNVQINGASGNGIVFDGGNANIDYVGTGNTVTAQGDGLVLSNLTGGTVKLSNYTAKATGGAGLRMDNVGTDIIASNLTTIDTLGPAVAITGTTGKSAVVNGTTTTVYNTYNFVGNTVISNPKGAGFTTNGTDAAINIANLNVTSTASSPAVSLVNNSANAITINNMTLNTNNGKGLYAVGLNLLKINGGTITSVNAPAVEIQGSTINTTFNSISANGGPFGISLTQSSGLFTVQGGGNYGSGGLIQNTTTGVLIKSFGTANLNWMNFATNGTAIQSTASAQLNLTGLQIATSTGYAIDSLDDSVLTLSSSVLSGNGAIGGGTIRVRADAQGTFMSKIAGNTITDTNGTAILLASAPSGSGASLASTIQSNTITSYRGGAAIIGVNWSGPASLTISNNALYAQASSMTGIQVNQSSTADSLVMNAAGNSVTFGSVANSGTGISIIAAGTSQLQVATNNIDFKATGGTGLRFALGGTSTDYIGGNIITDEAGGATGMLFDTVAANSRMQIDGNTINLLASDLTTHQGIIFTSVTPTIQFIGTANNLIYNTTSLQTTFSIPVNSATGGFYINGSLVQ
ncbi:beta strand repeat-containing protein [Schlesneria paludicola]|uniref:beta strand repeat-containing protein n=1 Tax=Schlesneria paludicola TaxID=360056 RepID=UPI000299E99E|nr:inverse autotransporter beta domain-containing protein [Schlesneria paludicola]